MKNNPVKIKENGTRKRIEARKKQFFDPVEQISRSRRARNSRNLSKCSVFRKLKFGRNKILNVWDKKIKIKASDFLLPSIKNSPKVGSKISKAFKNIDFVQKAWRTSYLKARSLSISRSLASMSSAWPGAMEAPDLPAASRCWGKPASWGNCLIKTSGGRLARLWYWARSVAVWWGVTPKLAACIAA